MEKALINQALIRMIISAYFDMLNSFQIKSLSKKIATDIAILSRHIYFSRTQSLLNLLLTIFIPRLKKTIVNYMMKMLG